MKRGFLKKLAGLDDPTVRGLADPKADSEVKFTEPEAAFATTSGAATLALRGQQRSQAHRVEKQRLPLSAGSAALPEDAPRTGKAAARAEVDEFGLRFGLDWDTDAYNTLCLVYNDNLRRLRAHPGYETYISPELCKKNARNVEIVSIDGKGLGLRAKRDLGPRQLILHACVVGWATRLDKRVAPDQYPTLLKLSNCRPGENELHGIINTNAFPTELPFDEDSVQSVVYDWMSRTNHDCTPNAQVSWDYESFCGSVWSTRLIKQGEEITISYTSIFKSAEERKSDLMEKYHFECKCRACTLPKKKQRVSDERREALSRHMGEGKCEECAECAVQKGQDVRAILGMLDAECMEKGTMLDHFIAQDVVECKVEIRR
ncbi:SET domain-containing protein [Dacryopinax primogenitus]|uniref:SET domain-containing protein n=1 Tax=Dacryopinax primogenitus (strain DJM 731) TaxID=1858805 RepID=M5FY79_DACPD|nr:SET domain-containing protein [Dacryopinax primogenitus]EJU03016.1 SET domain-containing protein [Dacryopinax primogenitus]